MARPSKRTDKVVAEIVAPTQEEVIDAVCALIMDGESLRSICERPEMPDRSTILRWIAADEKLAAKCARAREIQADTIFDEMQSVADEGNADDVQRAKLRVSTMQWRAAKLAPKRYGDKVALTGGGPEDAPIQHAMAVTFVKANG